MAGKKRLHPTLTTWGHVELSYSSILAPIADPPTSGYFDQEISYFFRAPLFWFVITKKEIERERARNGGGFSGPPLTYPNLVSGPSSSCNTHKNLDELSSIFKNQTTKSRTSVIRKNHQR